MLRHEDLGERVAPPVRTREIHNHHMDSSRWNGFPFRDGDIVIATWAKSGTTWTQQIVSQFIFQGAEGINVSSLDPWVDCRVVPQPVIDALEHQTHRRVLKTHLPVDALEFSPKAKYIYVARDGRDSAWSAYNHLLKATDAYYDTFTTPPGASAPPSTVSQARPTTSTADGLRTWWKIRHLPDVKLIQFAKLKRDLPGQIRATEPHRVCRRLQLLSRMEPHEQDNEQVLS